MIRIMSEQIFWNPDLWLKIWIGFGDPTEFKELDFFKIISFFKWILPIAKIEGANFSPIYGLLDFREYSNNLLIHLSWYVFSQKEKKFKNKCKEKKKVKLLIIIVKKGKKLIIDKTGSRIGSWKLRIFSQSKIKDPKYDFCLKDPDKIRIRISV